MGNLNFPLTSLNTERYWSCSEILAQKLVQQIRLYSKIHSPAFVKIYSMSLTINDHVFQPPKHHVLAYYRLEEFTIVTFWYTIIQSRCMSCKGTLR